MGEFIGMISDSLIASTGTPQTLTDSDGRGVGTCGRKCCTADLEKKKTSETGMMPAVERGDGSGERLQQRW